MNTQLLYANSILLSPHLFMSPVNYLLSDSANKPTSNDEGASIVCLSNLFFCFFLYLYVSFILSSYFSFLFFLSLLETSNFFC